ncbi:hypothetical protein HOY82DRAFT_590489 [Tuber indicum]|nr:hypothetical protein HOY82DRAFT_590489 [Tuber indicum]
MEFNRISGFVSGRKEEKGSQIFRGALPDQEPDNGMDFGGGMMDMYSSAGSTLDGALPRYESDVHITDGLESALGEGEHNWKEIDETPDTGDSNAQVKAEISLSEESRPKLPLLGFRLGGLSPLWGPWCSSCDDDSDTEELGSSNKGTMEVIPDSVDHEMGIGISTASEGSENQDATIPDGFCGANLPYPNDKGLSSTSSSFDREKLSAISSTEPKLQLSLVDVRQPRSLLGESSAAPSGEERVPLVHNQFSFRFPRSLPEAPANIGFPFSPRLGAAPYEGEAAYENWPDQGERRNPQSRLVKTAKRHYRCGTRSPDHVPLGAPVKVSGMTGDFPGELQFMEPGPASLSVKGPDTTCPLCTSSNTSPRCHPPSEGDRAEGCGQELSGNVCSRVGMTKDANRGVGHMGHMTKNTDIQVRGMEITDTQGGLHGKSGVKDHFHSALAG